MKTKEEAIAIFNLIKERETAIKSFDMKYLEFEGPEPEEDILDSNARFRVVKVDDRESTYNMDNNERQVYKDILKDAGYDSEKYLVRFQREDAFPNGTSIYEMCIEYSG